ncbi:hypothetical protein BH09PSE6_BH09PSE6_04280 [soil metagenome]
MRTFDHVFFPDLKTDPDDDLCARFQAMLHERLDRDQFGEVRINRSGPGIAVVLRVLDEQVSDDEVTGLVARSWSEFAASVR